MKRRTVDTIEVSRSVRIGHPARRVAETSTDYSEAMYVGRSIHPKSIDIPVDIAIKECAVMEILEVIRCCHLRKIARREYALTAGADTVYGRVAIEVA